jgi:hypothetical protein
MGEDLKNCVEDAKGEYLGQRFANGMWMKQSQKDRSPEAVLEFRNPLHQC